MKLSTPILLCASVLLTACGPYYVGRVPVEPAAELLASLPEVTPQPTPPIPDPFPAHSVGTGQRELETVPVEPQGPGVLADSQATEASGPPLIGWDGREVVEGDAPLKGIETDSGSRSYLIELFVKAKEDVENLQLEVEALRDLQRKQEQVILDREAMLGAERGSIADLEAELAAERARNAELEGRLVTAQIRRLEAERQLLLHILGQEAPASLQPDPGTGIARGVGE